MTQRAPERWVEFDPAAAAPPAESHDPAPLPAAAKVFVDAFAAHWAAPSRASWERVREAWAALDREELARC